MKKLHLLQIALLLILSPIFSEFKCFNKKYIKKAFVANPTSHKPTHVTHTYIGLGRKFPHNHPSDEFYYYEQGLWKPLEAKLPMLFLDEVLTWAMDGKRYVGLGYDKRLSATDQIFYYDRDAKKWECFQNFPIKFKKSIVVKIDGKTCIGLGHIQHVSLDGQYNKKFWYYENNTWQEFPHEFPETLHNPVVAMLDGKICIGLGSNTMLTQPNKKFWYYENNAWHEFSHEFPIGLVYSISFSM